MVWQARGEGPVAAGTRVGKQVTKERSKVAASVQADAVKWRDPFRT